MYQPMIYRRQILNVSGIIALISSITEIDPKLIYLCPIPPQVQWMSKGWRYFLIGTHIVTRNCVSRNHGITGCRRLLMSSQGVPDRIISLVCAPRELFPSLLLVQRIELDAA